MTRLFLGLGLAASLSLAPSVARERDQESAYEMRRQGQVMPLRRIEAMVVPREEAGGATYLRSSPEFDGERITYRLKFQRSYRVFWIEVDARTGREVARSGR